MRRPHPYSRRVFRQERRRWLLDHRWVLTAALGGLIGIGVVVTLIIVRTGEPNAFSWYLLGAMHVGLIGAGLAMVQTLYLVNDRRALHQLRGAWGEENTRDELAWATRRRLVWGWVDSLEVSGGDIDHVVVTRRGGMLAIDSKFRTTISQQDVAEMARAARRATTRAEGLAQALWTRERGARRRTSTKAVRVRPVVVLWGPEQHRLDDGSRFVDDVEFVAGRHFRQWLRQLAGDEVEREPAEEMLRGLLSRGRSRGTAPSAAARSRS